MTLAVPKKKWKKFHEIMKDRGVEATIIGKFTNSKKCLVTYKTKKIVDLDMEFLHNGLPQKKQISEDFQKEYSVSKIPPISISSVLSEYMGELNLSSTEYIVGQYDHEVQAGSVLKPIQGRGRVLADASVTRPLLDSDRAVVLSQALYSTYSEQDAYKMAACSVDTAIRNAVAAGADIDYLSLLDNFCWCSSTDPKRLGQLKAAVKACFDFATAYGTPFISGKDSMFNDFKGFDEKGNAIKVSIPPTLLISAIGVLKNSTKVSSLDFKYSGDLIYLLGETQDELGGSEFLQFIQKKTKKEMSGIIPSVDSAKNKKLYKKLFSSIQKDLISSSISLHHGGLANALFRSAIGGKTGAEINLQGLLGNATSDYSALFSESQGRILVSINPKNKTEFEKIMKGSAFLHIGKVTDEQISIKSRQGKNIYKENISAIEQTYKRRFKSY